MNKFERVLMKFGPAVFSLCFHIAVETERYEDCALMKQVAQKYDIELATSMEDWQAEFWRIGMAGETALKNTPRYFVRVLRELGYMDAQTAD